MSVALMGPSGGSKNAGLEYVGAVTQDGYNSIDKSIECKGYTTYYIFAGLNDSSHDDVAITATNGTVVGRTLRDSASVYSSYLKKNVDAMPSLAGWKIENCRKDGVTITFKKSSPYYWYAFFVYGIA